MATNRKFLLGDGMKLQVRSVDRRSGIFDAKKDDIVAVRLEFTGQSNHGIEVTAVRHANKTDLYSPAFVN